MFRLDKSRTALQLLQEKLSTSTKMAETYSQNSSSAVIGCYPNCLQGKILHISSWLKDVQIQERHYNIFLDFKQDTGYTLSSTSNFWHWTPDWHNFHQKTSKTCQIVTFLFDLFQDYLTCLLTEVTQFLPHSTQLKMY